MHLVGYLYEGNLMRFLSEYFRCPLSTICIMPHNHFNLITSLISRTKGGSLENLKERKAFLHIGEYYIEK
jgi:hypothetical protein